MNEDMISADGWASRSASRWGEPDAHGQAALLLAESTLHALVEAGKLTLAQAISVVHTASEVQAEIAAQLDGSGGGLHPSTRLLSGIERSLRTGSRSGDCEA